MQVFLEAFLRPRHPQLDFLCVAHEGKSDLEKSIPRKLRAWKEPGVRFIILRDNDRHDCRELKKRLLDLCKGSGRSDTIVRIVCQELEAWYFGDPEALAEGFGDPRLRRIRDRSQYRDSDEIPYPGRELERLVPSYQKLSGARRMAAHVEAERNNSPSFRVFLKAVDELAEELTLGD